MRRQSCPTFPTALLAALLAGGPAQAQYALTVIADSRNLPVGSYLAEASINAYGQVAFTAISFGNGAPTSHLYRTQGTGYEWLMSSPRPDGNGTGYTLMAFGNPNLLADGRIGFSGNANQSPQAYLWDNGSIGRLLPQMSNGQWLEANLTGELSDNQRFLVGGRLFQAGDLHPLWEVSAANGRYDGTLSHDGRQVALLRWNFSLGLHDGLYARNPSAQGLTALDASFADAQLAVNNQGLVALHKGAAIPWLGLMVGAPGQQRAEMLADGQRFASIGDGASSGGVALNNKSEVAFNADPLGDGLDRNVYTVQAGVGQVLTVVERGQEVAPGLTFVQAMGGALRPYAINDQGQLAFVAHLSADGGHTSFTALLRADPLEGVSPGNPIKGPCGDVFPSNRRCLPPPPDFAPRVRFVDFKFARPRTRAAEALDAPAEVLVGMDFQMESVDTRFHEFLVPAALAQGDASFELLFEGQRFAVAAGELFDFSAHVAGGVSAFRLAGIDPQEGLDPEDPQAFVLGLSYLGANANTPEFRFAALTAPAVPEPAPWALLALGMAGLAMRRYSALNNGR